MNMLKDIQPTGKKDTRWQGTQKALQYILSIKTYGRVED